MEIREVSQIAVSNGSPQRLPVEIWHPAASRATLFKTTGDNKTPGSSIGLLSVVTGLSISPMIVGCKQLVCFFSPAITGIQIRSSFPFPLLLQSVPSPGGGHALFLSQPRRRVL